ncbi:MAG: hypothetical protein QHH74_15995 [Spirochaetota bacterium]|nr:hypothetical protein [Spirochaetota bacterium]
MKFETLQQLLEYDASLHTLIEPDSRFAMVFDRLKDCIETYKPHVIVKIGLGNPKYIEAIMQLSKALCVVVEPSLPLLQSFYARSGTQEWMNRLYTIAGNFNDFPIDYYKADMLVCIDCLDLLDTGRAIDEFRRALQFEGVFFLAGFVLPNEDIEGIFDEIAHTINPLHTDYYLEDDLKTFLTLNEFGLAKSHTEKVTVNLFSVAEYLGTSNQQLQQLIDENKELLSDIYMLQNNETVTLPYMISAYIRQKPSSDETI